jgi:hypothetical protein
MKNLYLYQVGKENDILCLQELFSDNFSPPKTIQFIEAKIKNIVHSNKKTEVMMK